MSWPRRTVATVFAGAAWAYYAPRSASGFSAAGVGTSQSAAGIAYRDDNVASIELTPRGFVADVATLPANASVAADERAAFLHRPASASPPTGRSLVSASEALVGSEPKMRSAGVDDAAAVAAASRAAAAAAAAAARCKEGPAAPPATTGGRSSSSSGSLVAVDADPCQEAAATGPAPFDKGHVTVRDALTGGTILVPVEAAREVNPTYIYGGIAVFCFLACLVFGFWSVVKSVKSKKRRRDREDQDSQVPYAEAEETQDPS